MEKALFLEVMHIVGQWAQRSLQAQFLDWWSVVELLMEGTRRAMLVRMGLPWSGGSSGSSSQQ